MNLYRNIQSLSDSLKSKTYQPFRSICFYLQKPKLREVFAADFRDRVIHRLLVDILEPHYERVFIKDSYACRKGKGTHSAVNRVKDILKRMTCNSRKPYYFLQLDIKGFFMQIHKERLLQILSKQIASSEIQNLCKVIVQNDPTHNYKMKGKSPERSSLPPHKTLFHEDKNRGIPVGNLTSQFFSNVYLNEMDQFIKRRLGVKNYVRYVDDFILFSESKEKLNIWKEAIIQFIETHLSLELKDKAVSPESVYKGIDFLGYYIKPAYSLIRRRVYKSFQKALAESLPPKPVEKDFRETMYFQTYEEWKRLQARINSYLGHFKHANSFHIMKSLEKTLISWHPFLKVDKNKLSIYPKRPPRFYNLSSQIKTFQKLFSGKILLIEVGRYYEIIASPSELLLFEKHKLINRFYRRGKLYRGLFYKKVNSFIKQCKNSFLEGCVIGQLKGIYENVKIRMPKFSWENKKGTQLKLFLDISV